MKYTIIFILKHNFINWAPEDSALDGTKGPLFVLHIIRSNSPCVCPLTKLAISSFISTVATWPEK